MINASKAHIVSGWTLVLSGLVVAVLGLAVAGDAFAVDQPNNPRNRAAAKPARQGCAEAQGRAEGQPGGRQPGRHQSGPGREPSQIQPPAPCGLAPVTTAQSGAARTISSSACRDRPAQPSQRSQRSARPGECRERSAQAIHSTATIRTTGSAPSPTRASGSAPVNASAAIASTVTDSIRAAGCAMRSTIAASCSITGARTSLREHGCRCGRISASEGSRRCRRPARRALSATRWCSTSAPA